MRLLAFLAPEPVPLAVLLAGDAAAGRLSPAVAATVGGLLGDEVAAGDAIAALRRYSLVTPAGDGLVLVHRLVQAITRAQLPADEATGGGRPPPPWSRRRSPPTRFCLRRGRCARCCCRTPGLSLT